MSNNILDNIDNKSEEFDILMNDPPKFYLRSGFSIIFFFLLAVGVASYFIDYPDYISSEIKIVSITPRAPIISNINGRIIDLKKNNSIVKKGEILGVIENHAKLKDVLSLEKKLHHFNIITDTISFNKLSTYELKLGELQASYSSFLNAKNEFDIFSKIKRNDTKISNLKGELYSNTHLIESLNKEKEILIEKTKLSKSQLDRSITLYKKGVISLKDLETAKQKDIDIRNNLLSKTSAIRQMEANNLKTNSNLNLTKKEGDEIYLRLLSSYRTSLYQIKSNIEAWKKKYLLISPIDGKLVLNNIWGSQQVTSVGNEIGSIVPKNEHIFGIAKMPEFKFGKVKLGSNVMIYINGYNFSEFGIIKGTVKSISPVPYEGFYNVEIKLTNNLTTDNMYVIPFSPELSGEAKIITEKMNLFERLFYKIKRLFNRKKRENKNEDSK
ncbi:HlyD family secretion protein [Tenacibaculum amylolyticum]|uniref:HlyD family secretion protein n=1 Tax=Tenacibaculum amylolyticum TaxID=104269 RepID=UPI003893AF3A